MHDLIRKQINENRSGVWSDASKGKQIKLMPQSGVLATPHKGLKRNATVGRLSDIT